MRSPFPLEAPSFPRSTVEAFPHTPEYGAAIEVPYKPKTRLVSWVIGLVYLFALWVLGAVLAGRWI